MLVSHGSSVDPDSYEPLLRCARRLAGRTGWGEVAVGFLKQSPTLEEAWEATEGADRIVVPLLASAGYFAQTILPRRLGLEGVSFGAVQEHRGQRVIYTEPVGTDPGMDELVLEAARGLRAAAGRADVGDGGESTLLIIGHGTPRHRASGQSVRDCAARLRDRGEFSAVRFGFVDEEPSIASALSDCPRGEVFAVPYFICDGPHVLEDIPDGLGIEGDLFEVQHHRGRHRIFYAHALGGSQAIDDLVMRRADRARKVLARGISG